VSTNTLQVEGLSDVTKSYLPLPRNPTDLEASMTPDITVPPFFEVPVPSALKLFVYLILSDPCWNRNGLRRETYRVRINDMDLFFPSFTSITSDPKHLAKHMSCIRYVFPCRNDITPWVVKAMKQLGVRTNVRKLLHILFLLNTQTSPSKHYHFPTKKGARGEQSSGEYVSNFEIPIC